MNGKFLDRPSLAWHTQVCHLSVIYSNGTHVWNVRISGKLFFSEEKLDIAHEFAFALQLSSLLLPRSTIFQKAYFM